MTRVVAILLILAAVVLTFWTARAVAQRPDYRDFRSFWSAAEGIRTNPYKATIGMRNPPWTLPFVLPLGSFSYPTAFALWTIMTIALVAASARVLWSIFSSQPSLLPAVLSLAFGPTFCLILLGQLDAITLCGVTLFLWAIERNRQYWAGASLLLVLSKPHVVLFFLISVAAWTIWQKAYRILVGAGMSSLASCSISFLLNRNIWFQYVHYVESFTRSKNTDPNLSGLVYQFTLNRGLAAIPEILGLLWLGWYLWRHRADWEWKRHGVLCILVSILCSYYSFPYDEVLVLPAVLSCVAVGNRTRMLVGWAVVNSAYYLYLSNTAGKWGFGPLFLCWTGLAWILFYLWSSQTPVFSKGLETA